MHLVPWPGILMDFLKCREQYRKTLYMNIIYQMPSNKFQQKVQTCISFRQLLGYCLPRAIGTPSSLRPIRASLIATRRDPALVQRGTGADRGFGGLVRILIGIDLQGLEVVMHVGHLTTTPLPKKGTPPYRFRLGVVSKASSQKRKNRVDRDPLPLRHPLVHRFFRPFGDSKRGAWVLLNWKKAVLKTGDVLLFH